MLLPLTAVPSKRLRAVPYAVASNTSESLQRAEKRSVSYLCRERPGRCAQRQAQVLCWRSALHHRRQPQQGINEHRLTGQVTVEVAQGAGQHREDVGVKAWSWRSGAQLPTGRFGCSKVPCGIHPQFRGKRKPQRELLHGACSITTCKAGQQARVLLQRPP